MREVQPKQWTAELSQSYIADYKPFMFVDGEGVRCSLYVSGCPFRCPGCFNQAAQNFKYGTPYTAALEEQILTDLANDYVQGLTLLGGEPFLNTPVCLPLVQKVRAMFGDRKDIWAWSGYTFEQLLADTCDKQQLLNEIDVLVDGQFVEAERDLNLRFRGSRNQRIIDVPASLKAGHVILWHADEQDPSVQYEQVQHQI